MYTEHQYSQNLTGRHDCHFQVEALKCWCMSLHVFSLSDTEITGVYGIWKGHKTKMAHELAHGGQYPRLILSCSGVWVHRNMICHRFWWCLLSQHNLDQAYLITFSAMMKMFYICTVQYSICQPLRVIEYLKCGSCEFYILFNFN